MVEGSPRIFRGENALDDDGPLPEGTNPLHVTPSKCFALHHAVRVANPQHTSFRANNIRHVGKAAIEKKACQPARVTENLRQEGNLRPDIPTQELLHSVSGLALAVSDDRRIDCDDQGCETHIQGSAHGILCGDAATGEIELIPDRSCRSSLHVLQPMARNRGEYQANAGSTTRSGSRDFTIGMHYAEVTHG